MSVGESEDMIVHMRLHGIRQGLPAVAHVNAEEVEAQQHRGAVLNVEIEVPCLGFDGAVEQREHVVVVACLDRIHGQMPPEMAFEGIAVLPGVCRVIQPLHTLAQAALHLEDVGDRVDRPEVVRVGFDGPTPEFLGPRVLAAFL